MHVAEVAVLSLLFFCVLPMLLFCHCYLYIMHEIVRANPGRLRQSQREPDNSRHSCEGCERHATSF